MQCSERNDREDSARAAKGAWQVARPLSFPFPSPSAMKDSPSRRTADTRLKRPENEAMELKTRRIDGRERLVVTEMMVVPYDEVRRDEECHDETREVRGTQDGTFHVHARTSVGEVLTLCEGDGGLGLGGLGDWGGASSPLDDGPEDDGQVRSFLHFAVSFHFISFRFVLFSLSCFVFRVTIVVGLDSP